MKLNKIILVALVGIFALGSSCGDGTDGPEPFSYRDEVEQYAKDLDSIEHFLQIHYVNDMGDIDPTTYRFDSIPVGGGQTALINDSRLASVMGTADADHNDIDQEYKIYYIKFREGIGQRPTYVDSVYTTYKGTVVTGEKAEEVFDSSAAPIWFSLPDVLHPWSKVLPKIKGGSYTTNSDGTVNYDDFGIAAFFIPSGVGYYAQNTASIPEYTPLYFQVELRAVNTDVDHDHDGVLTIHEDLNHNGYVTDDNTDSDSYPNYIDVDDDNDGHLTKDEGADPNGDGNPSDAEDLDGDGIANYLDSDSH
jgi:hypothetical protein